MFRPPLAIEDGEGTFLDNLLVMEEKPIPRVGPVVSQRVQMGLKASIPPNLDQKAT